MDITHAQARELIQFDRDSALDTDSHRNLTSHLASCVSCRAYAESILAVEVRLRRSLKARWNLRPAQLDVGAIRNPNPAQRTVLTTRFAIAASAFLLFIAVTLRIAITTSGGTESPLGVPPIPTPSMQGTNTVASTLECRQVRYQVQPGDTLESIALQFSVSNHDLLSANNMASGIVISGTEIVIPLCDVTPTGTVRTPTFTMTIAPLFESLSYTPDG